MNKSNEISDMIFDLNDVIKILKLLNINFKINEEMLSVYPSGSISESMKTVFDLPKDSEGTPFSIGDCLENVLKLIEELSEGGN